jgi:DNA-binding protein HU-beta
MAKKARKAKSKAKKSKAKSKAKKKTAKKAKKAKKAKRKKSRRTVLYSTKGKKLYAVRDKTGKFKDIQSYQRAHSMDMKRKSKAEIEAAEAKAAGAVPAEEAPKPM